MRTHYITHHQAIGVLFARMERCKSCSAAYGRAITNFSVQIRICFTTSNRRPMQSSNVTKRLATKHYTNQAGTGQATLCFTFDTVFQQGKTVNFNTHCPVKIVQKLLGPQGGGKMAEQPNANIGGSCFWGRLSRVKRFMSGYRVQFGIITNKLKLEDRLSRVQS